DRRDTQWGPRRNSPATSLAAEISRAVEDVVEVGRGLVAFHVAGQESQAAVETVDPSALAQYGAVCLVAVDHGTGDGHRAIEGIDPPALGRRPVRLVGVDRAVGQRQRAVFTVDAAAQGGARGVDLVAVDEGIGDRRTASDRADTTPRGQGLVVD